VPLPLPVGVIIVSPILLFPVDAITPENVTPVKLPNTIVPFVQAVLSMLFDIAYLSPIPVKALPSRAGKAHSSIVASIFPLSLSL